MLKEEGFYFDLRQSKSYPGNSCIPLFGIHEWNTDCCVRDDSKLLWKKGCETFYNYKTIGVPDSVCSDANYVYQLFPWYLNDSGYDLCGS